MAREKTLGVSPITNTIYYGIQDTEKCEWVGEKTDVTKQAIAAVYQWFMGNMDGHEEFQISYPGTDFELVMRRKNDKDKKIYKLVLGDWSKDGHGISENFLFECNYDVDKIRQAYKDSCKNLGITFNHNENYTDYALLPGDERMIWTEYEESEINEFAFNILNKAGCLEDIEYEAFVFEGYEKYFISEIKDCAKLIMNFIAVSMPKDFTYKLIEEHYEPINGYWNKELNVQFGYGLFECD